jgi:hypothetical protein
MQGGWKAMSMGYGSHMPDRTCETQGLLSGNGLGMARHVSGRGFKFKGVIPSGWRRSTQSLAGL